MFDQLTREGVGLLETMVQHDYPFYKIVDFSTLSSKLAIQVLNQIQIIICLGVIVKYAL